jgi:hypothetical protein
LQLWGGKTLDPSTPVVSHPNYFLSNHFLEKDTKIICKIPEPQFPYPKISDLSIEDQKYFLDIYKEYISRKEIGSENLNQLQVLHSMHYCMH